MADAPDDEILSRGRDILRAEGEAVLAAAASLDGAFCRAVRVIEGCTGSVVVTGIGKAGLVARKISATLASTGTPSHFLHPVAARDVPIVALTARPESTLGRAATVVVPTGSVREACELGLAPSTSTSLMLALGDALALVTSTLRRFTPEDFAARHPGGSLGRQLMLVEEAMRPLAECRLARTEETVRAVFARPLPARRTGAVMVVDAGDRLEGIFTDSDLARLFERRHDDLLDAPIGRVMTPRPTTVPAGTRLRDAVAILEARRLSELPVVDAAGRALGLLDIVDLVGFVPHEQLARSQPRQHAA
jgi:arabinose-5-phosphate isomerase